MHLNLENQCLTDEKLVQILRRIDGTQIQFLKLRNNNLTEQSLRSIGYWLYASSKHTQNPIELKEVDLSENLDLLRKGDAAKYCVQLLRQCTKLTSLSLGNTSLDSTSFQYIAKYLLQYNRSLKYFDASGLHNTIEFCYDQSTLEQTREKLYSFLLTNRYSKLDTSVAVQEPILLCA